MRNQPFTHKKTLGFFIVLASLVGLLLDYSFGTQIDYWLHDSALVYQKRQEWKYSGVVVLDDDVPFRVTRIQALPLFAKAVERLVAQGTKGIFLDARVSKEIEGKMPYAVCLENDGQARWSTPTCAVNSSGNICTIGNSEAGNAPLKMNTEAIARFRLAPYLGIGETLPDFLLFDLEATEAIPAEGLVASDRLVTKSTPIARWLDMSDDHAIFKLISLLAPDKVASLYQKNELLDETCDNDKRCRRIRLSEPIYTTHEKNGKLILPLSKLAACDERIANQTAVLLKNKVAILQTTSPDESTDIMVTPMTTALFGPQALTPGAQYLVDEVETLLNQDFPRRPPQAVRIGFFVCAAMLSVLIGAFYSQTLLWLTGIMVFFIIIALSFFNHLTQLWPISAVMAAYGMGAVQIVATHLVLGLRYANLSNEYMPQAVVEMLISLKSIKSFQPRNCKVVVLMSDLAGYTTVTGLLKKPEYVMNLMNDYLDQTSIVLQNTYKGILEAYVGDMVCYYWLYEDEEQQEAFNNVLLGAIELAQLQKDFFSKVSDRYKDVLTPDVIKKIEETINAGIGVTAGDAVRGNLGPKNGVKKFSILGDPLNLAARAESLTRHFNTEIIIAGENFSKTVLESEDLATRRLGIIRVKGRTEAAVLYALGKKDEPRFALENLQAWEKWSAEIEAGHDVTDIYCPEIYNKDKKTLMDWRDKGVLDNGIWQLHEK
jgi:adenylate cyclase